MALFQSSVLKDQLRLQDEQQLNKAYKGFTDFFHNPDIQENIRSSKEEQFQATFLNELFVKVLGYTMNPQPEYNLTTEFKNQKNARKADGAILKDGQAIGVIELKGTNTKHLEGIRQQAFDYKANQKGCVYVITSNFEKLRFYINDATEFVEFDLFELNREDFSLLWFCLHRENLLSEKPLKSKEASLVEEEVITKQFYKDYSVFKRELYRDLVKRNAKKLKSLRKNYAEAETSDEQDAEAQVEMVNLEKNVKQNLFKKSQKLIDRFLFIFFAEDRALLPPNSIHKILSDWNKLQDLDAEMPLYDRFKLYFGYLDSGRKGTDKKAEIFAYNGGLFKPDPVLDMLEIDDELLYKHTSRLATYDFESQVDVNILGHIFENSLNEIESVNAEIEGADFDKQKSKRKKDGVFYTPKYITKYIVENTVGRLCEEKKSELGFREEEYFRGRKRRQKDTLEALVKILEDYREWLLQLTICDPACGSGAFLNQALDFLIKEHRYIDEMKAKLLGGKLILSDIENTILERNIYGVDINEESVEIAKLSLWLRTAQPRRKLNDLSNSIKCGNSLIDDRKVAGNKAFKWEAEFPEVFAKGGFDVVIGNPPYVRQEKLGTETKQVYIEKFSKVGNGTADLYIYFYELATLISRSQGIISFITPNKWFKTLYGKNLREYLLAYKIIEIVDFFENKIFEDASTEPQIITFYNSFSSESFFYRPIEDKLDFAASKEGITVSKADLKKEEWVFASGDEKKVLDKLFIDCVTLENYTNDGLKRGILTGLNSAFIFDKKVRNRLIASDPQSEDLIEPYTNATDIKSWHLENKGDYYFLNTGYDINISPVSYPAVYEYLNSFNPQLSKRQDQGKTPFNLRACDYYSAFKKPKIIFIHTAVDHQFYFDTEGTFINNNSYLIINADYALAAILNSKVFCFLKVYLFPAFGNSNTRGRSRLNREKMNRVPIPRMISSKSKQNFENKGTTLKKLTEVQYTLVQKFEEYLLQSFKLEKTSTKLQSWHELEFGDFIKELNKAIKASNKVRAKEAAVLAGESGDAPTVVEVPTLTKKDEFEWMELFEENKKKVQDLQREIEKADKELDAMVYELYGLTEEEIRIIKDSIN